MVKDGQLFRYSFFEALVEAEAGDYLAVCGMLCLPRPGVGTLQLSEQDDQTRLENEML